MTGMMKSKIAYANEFGNPAGKRMVSPNPLTYDFGNGDFGTHYMGSVGNYAVPFLQENNGKLEMIPDKDAQNSKEAIRFDRDEDAEYFAEHYKEIAPMMYKKYGGENMKKLKGKVTKTGYKSNSPDKKNDFNIIPSNRITMKGVNKKLLLVPMNNMGGTGHPIIADPGTEHLFPDYTSVLEIPYYADGGPTKSKTVKYLGVDMNTTDAEKIYNLKNQFNSAYQGMLDSGSKTTVVNSNHPMYRTAQLIDDLHTKYNIAPEYVPNTRLTSGIASNTFFDKYVNPAINYSPAPAPVVTPPVQTAVTPAAPVEPYTYAPKFKGFHDSNFQGTGYGVENPSKVLVYPETRESFNDGGHYIPTGYHMMSDGNLMRNDQMYNGGGSRNFKSNAAYKAWLAYGHATGAFERKPGNQKVSIQGRAKNVDHTKKYGGEPEQGNIANYLDDKRATFLKFIQKNTMGNLLNEEKQMVREFQQGGSFATDEFLQQPADINVQSFDPNFNIGFETDPMAGYMSQGQNQAQPQNQVQQQYIYNPQVGANAILGATDLIGNLLERSDRNKQDKQMKKKFTADAVFSSTPYGVSGQRGDYTTNAGDFRPDNKTPVQFSGYNYKKGGPIPQNKPVYLSQAEINQILKSGGTVEYLD